MRVLLLTVLILGLTLAKDTIVQTAVILEDFQSKHKSYFQKTLHSLINRTSILKLSQAHEADLILKIKVRYLRNKITIFSVSHIDRTIFKVIDMELKKIASKPQYLKAFNDDQLSKRDGIFRYHELFYLNNLSKKNVRKLLKKVFKEFFKEGIKPMVTMLQNYKIKDKRQFK